MIINGTNANVLQIMFVKTNSAQKWARLCICSQIEEIDNEIATPQTEMLLRGT